MPCIGKVVEIGTTEFLVETVGTHLGMDILKSAPKDVRRFVELLDMNLSMTCGFLSQRVSLITGGCVETRGFPFIFWLVEKGQEMGKELSDEKKLYIVEMLEKGCTYKQISADLGISNGTIAAVKREFFGDDKMRKSIVAGDKFHGLLECVGKNQFKGSVRVKGGKFETKRFITSSRQEAEKLWNEWKEEVLKDRAPEITNPPIVVAMTNNKHFYSPNPHVNTNREVTHALIPTNPTDRNDDIIEIPIPNKEGTDVEEECRPIYLLVVGDPRIAGYSYDEERARKIMGLLNYALETAGVDVRYSVVQMNRLPNNADEIKR